MGSMTLFLEMKFLESQLLQSLILQDVIYLFFFLQPSWLCLFLLTQILEIYF